MTEKNIKEIEAATIRLKTSTRGGGIEIDLTNFGHDGKMTAYQNYLGGGLLGSIQNDCTISDWRNNSDLVKIADNLSRYFHSLTNPSDSEWESMDFDTLQRMPSSAY